MCAFDNDDNSGRPLTEWGDGIFQSIIVRGKNESYNALFEGYIIGIYSFASGVPTPTTTTVTAATCPSCHHHQSVTTLASNEPVTVTRLHCGCQGCNTLQRSHTGSHTPTSSVHNGGEPFLLTLLEGSTASWQTGEKGGTSLL